MIENCARTSYIYGEERKALIVADRSIWDLKKGDRVWVSDGFACEVLAPTEDGKGLPVKYIDGELSGQEDFVFEDEILFEPPAN